MVNPELIDCQCPVQGHTVNPNGYCVGTRGRVFRYVDSTCGAGIALQEKGEPVPTVLVLCREHHCASLTPRDALPEEIERYFMTHWESYVR